MHPEERGGYGRAGAAQGAVAPPPGVTAAAILRHGASRLAVFLRRQATAEAEQRRLFPWLAVAMGAGILAYFGAREEPSLWAPVAGLCLSGALAIGLARRGGPGFRVALATAAAFAGFAAGCLRTASVAAPVLDRPRVARLVAEVEAVEARSQGGRLLLRPLSLQGLDATRLPRRVRVTVPNRPTMAAGDTIAGLARLLPPPEASRPGGYDFAREAYFGGVGAVGSLAGAIELVPAPLPEHWRRRWAAAVDRARNDVTRRIASAVGGAAGGVAASLVTGKRGLIPDSANDDLRAAGIYHVVSISGLHMVLAAGMVFWAVRALLALAPALGARWPIKKLAALAGMAAATGYNSFAGSEIATERSLVMILVMLGAVLADRPAFSMRNLAIAALVVLALEPESLLGPSFQMSFGAVAALIAVFEKTDAPALAPEAWAGWSAGSHGTGAPPAGPLLRAVLAARRHVLLAILTTLVAEAATGPFSLYHFQRVTPYGLVGNALTLPLVSCIVMPAAVLGIVAIPFGWDAPVWQVMGWGVTGMLRISAMVAQWPGSTAAMPAFGPGALGLLTLALLVATLCRSALRWSAVALAAAGVAAAALAPRPLLLATADGRSLAVRGADGRLAIVGRGPSDFVLEQWLRADGDTRAHDDRSLFESPRCDPAGCVARLPDGRPIAQVLRPEAFREDCRRAAVIVSPLAAPAICAPPVLLDARRLAATGAVTVFRDAAETPGGRPGLNGEGPGFRLVAAREPGTDRPWMRQAPAPRNRPAADKAAPGGPTTTSARPPQPDDADDPAAGPDPMDALR
ncbi:MAG: ComEC/Rec2 family competence protein [Alsobacter sp.]